MRVLGLDLGTGSLGWTLCEWRACEGNCASARGCGPCGATHRQTKYASWCPNL